MHIAEPINRFHVVVAGFCQDVGHPNGSLQLWRRLHGKYASPDTCVDFLRWSDSMSDRADMIRRCGPVSSPYVNIYGYSWGGYSAVELARKLEHRGIAVDNLILCDAVYRHRYWLGRWRAFAPFCRIVIPPNVRHVTWFYQRQNLLLKGHRVVDWDRRERWEGVELLRTHIHMDDSQEFHGAAMEAADRIHGKEMRGHECDPF